MTGRNRLVAGILALGLLLGIAAAWAQGVKKDVQQADLYADKFVFDYSKNEFRFTGNCRLEIKGPDRGTMTAPNMFGKLASKTTEITQITASGPVKFEILTKKDAEGVQRLIKAGCAGEAVYTGAKKLVVLKGGAEAVMTTVPEDPKLQPAKFTGKTLEISLLDFTIGGDDIHIEMQFPAEQVDKLKKPK